MDGIILYRSKYGATRRYAGWLAEETGFPCVDVRKTDIREVRRHEVIVFGGAIYASGISGLSFLRRHIDDLRGRKVIAFCCGASPYEESAFRQIRERNMTGPLSDVPLYYCRGAWDMAAMSFMDRTLCTLLRNSVAKKAPADYEPWEKALMEAGDGSCDWTDRAYLTPILEAIDGPGPGTTAR